MTIKVTVVYHDTVECVRALADAVAAVAWNTGADVRLRRLPEAEPDLKPADPRADPPATARDLSWADVVVLGAPARDRDVVALLRRLSNSATAPATASAAREMRGAWVRRTEEQVFGVFVTTPAPGTLHGGLMRSFGIVHRPAPGRCAREPERSVAILPLRRTSRAAPATRPSCPWTWSASRPDAASRSRRRCARNALWRSERRAGSRRRLRAVTRS
ncbi:hypothetical protein ACIBSV_01750 [Embleya sp. NPDC050154]|uniref:hypothetical protein n=1 Tax=Embleya sp. NPDC050154 TaxID=3363988 RepID=UPI0037919D8C